MDPEHLAMHLRLVTDRQDKTNRLLVAIARRLDRNEASMRRLMQAQLRFFQGPLQMLDEFGDDLSYEDVVTAAKSPAQKPQKPQKSHEGASRHELDADGSNYFRHELPGRRWLLIHTDARMRVLSVVLELPDGTKTEMSPEEALTHFADLPFWNLVTEPTPSDPDDPTSRPLNPDVEV